MSGSSTSGYDAIEMLVDPIDGWMSHAQGRRLWDAVRRVPEGGRIVEIGSFQGRSTVVLARAAADAVEVIAIDPHAGNDRGPREIEGYAVEAAGDHTAFCANLERAGVTHRVRHVRRMSDAAHGEINGPIDLLYVDGAHRYRPARADLRDWGARVRGGGTLVVHDAFSSVGVTLAILRELTVTGRFRYVGRTRSLAEFVADPAGSRALNVARVIAQLPWFVRNLGLKVALTLGLGRLLGGRAPEWPY